jgi:hypothetical protein
MAAPDPDFDRFDAVAARMPDLARAVDAFADPKLRERTYYELIGILNPGEDGDTLSPADFARLVDATHEEARDGESYTELILRLLDELRQHRAYAANRAAQERWATPVVEAEPDNSLTGAVQAYKDRAGI